MLIKMSISNLIHERNKFMNYVSNMIDIRKESGLTQEQLAKKLGWSRPQIARYETRKSIPSVEYLIAFCNYYNISADRVLGLNTKKGSNRW